MKGKKNRPDTTPPRVARVLELVDKPKEPKVPLLKKMRLTKSVETQVPTPKE
jgi:hypothetical protein